jgi:hypothetical protein
MPSTPISRSDSGYALQANLREKRSAHFETSSRRSSSVSLPLPLDCDGSSTNVASLVSNVCPKFGAPLSRSLATHRVHRHRL